MRVSLLAAVILGTAAVGCGPGTTAKSAPEGASRATAKGPAASHHGEPAPHREPAADDPSVSAAPPAGAPAEDPSSRQTDAATPPTPAAFLPPQYRPSDTRPRHDDARLAEQGIAAYESKRLKLYTDIDAATAHTLPPLIDEACLAWEAYLGELPPDRERTEYQMTGYLMRDQQRFRRAGLLPEDLRTFVHGRHRGAEFWMNDQQFDYYRRHLLVHEATHCFMTALHDDRDWPAPWYMEGMAELFGTHRCGAAVPDGADDRRAAGGCADPEFRVMPDGAKAFLGHGRIALIRDAAARGESRTFDEVLALEADDYLENEAYAWSWALCHWLDRHPRYSERFHELGGHLSRADFERTFHRLFDADLPELRVEWTVFAHSLTDGYDVPNAAIAFKAGSTVPPSAPSNATVRADRGWQSSGVRVARGQTYAITASGRFTLAGRPKPWVSEPQGISIRYFGGRPLGQLLACVHADGDRDGARMLRVDALGRSTRWTAPADGTLYLRLNDSWAELDDNAGQAEVEIRLAPAQSAAPDSATRPAPP